MPVIRRPVLVVAVVVALLGGVLAGPMPAAEGVSEPPPTVSEYLPGLPVADGEPGESVLVGRLDAQDIAEDVQPTGDAFVHSAPVPTPIPFSMIGFSVPEGAQVSFRTSVDGQDWEPWQRAPTVDALHGPDGGGPEAEQAAPAQQRTEAVWLGEASWLQVRVQGASPTEVGATLIDSMGLSQSLPTRLARALQRAWDGTARPNEAAADVDGPDVVSRSEWGADESRRGHGPHYSSDVDMGVVHHTAGANDYSESEAPGVVRGIYRWHTEGNGWSDIGYNLLIDRFGNVYEGRHGGLEKGVIGAHARGWNADSFGVSLMGCFDPGCEDGGGSVSEEAREALASVLAWKFDVHHIDVRAEVDKHNQTVPTLAGHGDVGETPCPGERVNGMLGELVEEVDQLQQDQGGVIVDPDVSPASGTLAEDGALQDAFEFTSRLRASGEWTLEVLDPESNVVRTDQGAGEVAQSRWQGTDQLEPGTYQFTFSSPGRRSATGTFEVSPECDQAFCDILGSVHESAILSLHEREIVSGCEEDRYCPRERVRRDHMAAFTARALELKPETDTTEPHFDDVEGNPHEEHINALADHGIVRGEDGNFMPDQTLSRDQMAAFLARALELDEGEGGRFTDIEGSVHEDAINAIAAAEVTKGYGDGTFRPRSEVLRDQIASFLHRALDADESGQAGQPSEPDQSGDSDESSDSE